jgi:hypothetical protein
MPGTHASNALDPFTSSQRASGDPAHTAAAASAFRPFWPFRPSSCYTGHSATTGYASFTVSEDSRGRPDPFDVTMFNVATFPEPADPYESRYPCLNVHLDGVWYYGTYAL